MSKSRSKKVGEAMLLLVFVLLCAAIFYIGFWRLHHRRAVGMVDGVAHTSIVPQLGVPLDSSTNVIWCGTLALAWNELMQKNGGPIQFKPPAAIAEEFNRQDFTAADLDAPSYVVMSGMKSNDIEKKFRGELQRKFGLTANPPKLDSSDPGEDTETLAIYAYLSKNLSFTDPFNVNVPLWFGSERVRAFGFGHEKFAEAASLKLRQEVRLLSYVSDDNFIIELKTKSEGDQLILAKIPAGKTLQETVDSVLPALKPDAPWGLNEDDKLSIPKIDFDLITHFNELEGKIFAMGKITIAAENIVFQLNENGVELQSYTAINTLLDAVQNPPKPVDLVFDKPFLVLLKRTDSKRPYFAMWIGNPSLLVSP